MIDPRGGEVISNTHSVKTLSKAIEWCSDVTESDLPITIYQQKTPNGRVAFQVVSSSREIIYQQG